MQLLQIMKNVIDDLGSDLMNLKEKLDAILRYAFEKRGTFVLNSTKHDYFYHHYNMTILNERFIEVPIVKEYINDNDPVKEWLSENYTITSNLPNKILAKDLYEHFRDDNLNSNITNRNFGKLMRFNNIGLKRSNGKRYYTNIVRK